MTFNENISVKNNCWKLIVTACRINDCFSKGNIIKNVCKIDTISENIMLLSFFAGYEMKGSIFLAMEWMFKHTYNFVEKPLYNIETIVLIFLKKKHKSHFATMYLTIRSWTGTILCFGCYRVVRKGGPSTKSRRKIF